jgi:hypothetical protein
MTLQQLQLERDLDTATSNGEQLARTQIILAIGYLSQGLSFEPSDIRELLNEIMSDYPERPKLRVVAGTKHRVTQ